MQESGTEVIVLLIVSTIVVLILVAIIMSTLVISQKRKFRNRQKMEEMRTAYEREILKTQLEIQTQTFESISRELHDNVGVLISLASINMKTMPPPVERGGQEKIIQTTELLNEAMDTLRDLSHSLHPEWLAQAGIRKALESELGKMRRTGLLETELITTGNEFSISPKDQIILFRMVQEILNNSIKHADATRVTVRLNFRDPTLVLQVTDNGKGFDPALNQEMKGIGMKNIFARAKFIRARVELNSSGGQGTTYIISYEADKSLM